MTMEGPFAEQVSLLRETYSEDAVSVLSSMPPALRVVVTLVGTCAVTLAPSDLLERGDLSADDETSHSIVELTESYATSYSFLYQTHPPRLSSLDDGEEEASDVVLSADGDENTAYVTLTHIDDVTLPSEALASLENEVKSTLATFDNNAVAVVLALEAAQQSAQAHHETEAVRVLKAEAKTRRLRAAAAAADAQKVATVKASPRHGAARQDEDELRQLGRRCVYFHHIFCTHKRASMSAWCQELDCFALCKIGYPGFLVLEGREASCTEYVRRLQGLHWKHMEVRGEELILVTEAAGLDRARCIPPRRAGECLVLNGAPCAAAAWPRYVETTSAAEMGLWCRGCQLEDLFRTGMRIYRAA